MATATRPEMVEQVNYLIHDLYTGYLILKGTYELALTDNDTLEFQIFFSITRTIFCSSDREKLSKFEAEGREFAKNLRSLEQSQKGQNNF